jgi:Protein of unknown function (DUF2878)
MSLLLNIAVFQFAWFSSVIGSGRNVPWLGPLAVLVALAIHFRAARRPIEELMLLLCCALIGAGFDSALVAAGWVRYPSGSFSASLAPYWIITMWMLFATTLNVSMRWLRGRSRLSALFGCIGGPAAYVTGRELGGIELVDQFAALAALGIGWAFIMPLLMRLSESFDGMSATPAGRRVWPAPIVP